ncbi:MAG: hypothetical protein R3F62_25945 [Planctomycetota bacterium]
MLPAVGALGKPMFTPCPQLCEAGCGAYAERPDECRAFRCAWHRGDGQLADDDRPDRVGLMIETCVSPGEPEIRYVRVWETRPEWFEDEASDRALELLDTLASAWPIKLHRYGQPGVYGPLDPLARADLRALADELRRREANTQE